jgi:hypothetical protein
MTKYLEDKFSVGMGGETYASNWERIFGKGEAVEAAPLTIQVPEALRPREEDKIEPSPLLCEHANEVPSRCPCADDCYCRSNTCIPAHWAGRVRFPTLTELVGKDKRVKFVRYQDGELWYSCDQGFQFPVKIEECGTAAFMAEDKSMFFMRWIRKYLDFLTSLNVE